MQNVDSERTSDYLFEDLFHKNKQKGHFPELEAELFEIKIHEIKYI